MNWGLNTRGKFIKNNQDVIYFRSKISKILIGKFVIMTLLPNKYKLGKKNAIR